MLDVHDDVHEVEQDPATVALALAARRPGSGGPHLLLDGVDDRAHLPFVRTGDDHEHIRDRKPVRHVDQQDVLRQLVRGGLGRHLCELDGFLCCGHISPCIEIFF